ncbi:VOC family protein [Saccharopolyspora erythraea]|uniref:VOC family protein n=1 Tax=Saccharopolyspora erythraea TaxID=1836 RepID=UPI001BA97F55|nr:glyoxalase superfamily protein [Saccharopolyspora erythraea]QUH05540.1 VOC family protein [Saccharopolyspora erythraea]
MFRDAFPIISTPDLGRALRFYRDALGFRQDYRFPADGEPDFVTLVLHAFTLGLGRAPEATGGHNFALWLYTDDVDAAVARLRDAGAPVLAEPLDMPWGERVASVADPDGNTVHIGAEG